MDAYIPRDFTPELLQFIESKLGEYDCCSVCGIKYNVEPYQNTPIYEEIGFCCPCTRRLSALFFFQHSGDFGDLFPSPIERKPKLPQISRAMALRVIGRCDYKCVQCGARDALEVDHIKPLAKGREHTKENIQALCAKLCAFHNRKMDCFLR